MVYLIFYDLPLGFICGKWWVALAALKLATLPTLRPFVIFPWVVRNGSRQTFAELSVVSKLWRVPLR